MSKAQEQIKTMASSVLKVCLGAFQESSAAMPPSVTTPSLGNLISVTTKAVECIGLCLSEGRYNLCSGTQKYLCLTMPGSLCAQIQCMYYHSWHLHSIIAVDHA